jgi:hypothetical protein
MQGFLGEIVHMFEDSNVDSCSPAFPLPGYFLKKNPAKEMPGYMTFLTSHSNKVNYWPLKAL